MHHNGAATYLTDRASMHEGRGEWFRLQGMEGRAPQFASVKWLKLRRLRRMRMRLHWSLSLTEGDPMMCTALFSSMAVKKCTHRFWVSSDLHQFWWAWRKSRVHYCNWQSPIQCLIQKKLSNNILRLEKLRLWNCGREWTATPFLVSAHLRLGKISNFFFGDSFFNLFFLGWTASYSCNVNRNMW